MKTFTPFSESQPTKKGQYIWKVPYRGNLTMVFVAWFTDKYLGNPKLYPYFSHWNGASVVVPQGIQWRKCDSESQEVEFHNFRLLEILHNDTPITLQPCPLCKRTPIFEGSDGFIGAFPHHYNMWSPKCCNMIHSYSFRNHSPVKLAEAWNAIAER